MCVFLTMETLPEQSVEMERCLLWLLNKMSLTPSADKNDQLVSQSDRQVRSHATEEGSDWLRAALSSKQSHDVKL